MNPATNASALTLLVGLCVLAAGPDGGCNEALLFESDKLEDEFFLRDDIKSDSDASKPKVVWARLLGSVGDDEGRGIAISPNGMIYITGHTEGNLGGETNTSGQDFFLAKYQPDGTNLWTRLLGAKNFAGGPLTPYYTNKNGVAVDNHGYVYVTGWTTKGLPGISQIGSADAFVVGYDANGKVQWRRLINEPGGTTVAHAITVRGYSDSPDAGVYITGGTNVKLQGVVSNLKSEVFLAELWKDGSKVVVRGLYGGPQYDSGLGIALTYSERPMTVGGTTGDTPGVGGGFSNQGWWDVILERWIGSASYSLGLWPVAGGHDHLGSSGYDRACHVATHISGKATDSYTVGFSGSLPVVEKDEYGNVVYPGPQAPTSGVFLLKKSYIEWNDKGSIKWVRYVNTTTGQGGAHVGVATDANGGRIYVTGGTDHDLGGDKNQGGTDIFVARFDEKGTQDVMDVLGTPANEIGNAVAVGANGRVYIVGTTNGDMASQKNVGKNDAFLLCLEYPASMAWTPLVVDFLGN